MMRTSLGIVAGLAAWAVPSAHAQTRGVPYTGHKWQLDVDFHDPQRLMIRLPGEAKETTYWYVLYQATNNTGRDVEFFPSCRLVTDTLKVVDGGDEVHPAVYEAIAQRHGVEYPFFTLPNKASGLLLQGRENARASVAVFRDFDPTASAFTVYLGGFSGDVDRIPNPTFDPGRPESPENPRSFVLRKTLALRYDLPGDPVTRAASKPVRRTREWVMR
jgi:hypothetical protein